MDRPDYVACIKAEPMEGKPSRWSWCDRYVAHEYAFVDVSHAVAQSLTRGRTLLCPACVDAVKAKLEEQTWRPEQ